MAVHAGLGRYWHETALRTILAARLDAVRRKAGDDRAEQIAQAIETPHRADHFANYLDATARAARIARESQ